MLHEQYLHFSYWASARWHFPEPSDPLTHDPVIGPPEGTRGGLGYAHRSTSFTRSSYSYFWTFLAHELRVDSTKKREKEKKIPVRWEVKRENINISPCLGSEKRKDIFSRFFNLNLFPTKWEEKRERKKIISNLAGSESGKLSPFPGRKFGKFTYFSSRFPPETGFPLHCIGL